MAVKQLFSTPPQFVDANGNPYSGALLFFYAAGSSTKQNVYTDSSGGTAASNPTTLNSSGYPAASGTIFTPFGTVGQTYKIGLAAPGASDPPASFIWTVDNIAPINDTTVSIDQWVTGATPTYVSATSFTLVGDQTSTYHVGRRLKTTNSGGTIYSTIYSSTFGALTTIVVVNDSGTLDAGLSAVSYGLLSASDPSTPLLTDAFPVVSGSADKTKKLRIEVDGFTTATTRVLTLPDQNLTIGATTTAGDLLQATSAGVLARLGIGTALQTLRTNAGATAAEWATPNNIDQQIFNGSGTWTKPSGMSNQSMAFIQGWGGGGSGGKGAASAPEGGGGGGGYTERWMLLSALGATETVTIGAGGVGQTVASTAGNAGGNTTFGAHLTAYGGGGGGANAAGGGGGGGVGALAAGATGSGTTGGAGGRPSAGDHAVTATGDSTAGGGGGGNGATDATAQGGWSYTGGGGGGGGCDAAGSTTNNGGNSVYGGGGGGGAANSGTAGTGGTSINGGAGSAGTIDSNNSSAGTQPGGGSGGTEGGDSGAGGAGRCVVTVFGEP